MLKGTKITSNTLCGFGDPDTPNWSQEHLNEMFECARPNLSNGSGKVIICGTGGEIEQNDFIKDMFYNNSK